MKSIYVPGVHTVILNEGIWDTFFVPQYSTLYAQRHYVELLKEYVLFPYASRLQFIWFSRIIMEYQIDVGRNDFCQP